MIDSQSVKDIALSTITGSTVLPGTARTFARIVSDDPKKYVRRSTHVSAQSPTDLKISHQLRKKSTDLQRSIATMEQTLTRLDSVGNPIPNPQRGSVSTSTVIPEGMTLTEHRALWATLAGWLLADDGANIDAMYRGEC